MNGCIRIKKEEEFESDGGQEINSEEVPASNEKIVDRTPQLISELMTLRGAYNYIYFQLQKAKELSEAGVREQKQYAEVLKKKEAMLRSQQNENRKLAEILLKVQNDLNSLREAERKEIGDLRIKKRLLEARVNQLQFGVAERQNFESQQHRSSRNKKTMPKNGNVFEVESILNDEFRKGKQYFLVKWKSFDHSENSWEKKSNLNCPKILKKYFDSKYL